MYNTDSRMRRDINAYLNGMREANLCEGYIRGSRSVLLKFQDYCHDMGIAATSRVTVDEVRGFMDKYQTKSGAYRRVVWASLRCFLSEMDNGKALRFRLRITGYCRQRVDWLTPTETEEMLAMPMTSREAVLVRGGLLQGLRKIEILRLTRHDAEMALRDKALSVRGKGGKTRTLPLHPGFAVALNAYLDRNGQLAETDPLLGIGSNTAYQCVVDLSKRFGHRIATHTLRRSAGRNLWLLGVPIETIAEFYGHASCDMTRMYLGINMVDMRKAISQYGTRSELKIILKVPQRRIAPERPADEAIEENPSMEAFENPGQTLSAEGPTPSTKETLVSDISCDPHTHL